MIAALMMSPTASEARDIKRRDAGKATQGEIARSYNVRMELLNSTGRFDILLGMDILSNCSLKIEFDRHYSICW